MFVNGRLKCQSSAMETISRRALLGRAALLALVTKAVAQPPHKDPWAESELMEPAALAEALQGTGPKPTVISVAFPVLYRQRHIENALPAGPTSKPEGLALLKQTVTKLPKDQAIVIYCGCCPMEHCPNIRPAYSVLKTKGFRNVKVLQLRTNLRTDWTAKGYPVASSV